MPKQKNLQHPNSQLNTKTQPILFLKTIWNSQIFQQQLTTKDKGLFETQTFADVEYPEENRSRNNTEKQHPNLLSTDELADPRKQIILLLHHFGGLTCCLDRRNYVIQLFIQCPVTPWAKSQWPSSHCSSKLTCALLITPNNLSPNTPTKENVSDFCFKAQRFQYPPQKN